MLHPSYSDLINVVNSEVGEGETPVVNSRYSIVMATSKRARQIVNGAKPLIDDAEGKKALSIAVEELEEGLVKIVSDEEAISEDDDDDAEVPADSAAPADFANPDFPD